MVNEFKREDIINILNQAQCIDSKYELFGASKHQYKLNPPISASFVHEVEEKYGFTLPKDYFSFITEVGDGGAGPEYGIIPFGDFLEKGVSAGAEKFMEAYRQSVAYPFTPRQMKTDEVEDFAITTREVYEQNPERFFIYEKADDNDLCDTDGFLVLGTYGCQWDFGLVITGEKRGCIFDTDHEGAYGFVACSFYEFYRNWLERISDKRRLQDELEQRRIRFQKRN